MDGHRLPTLERLADPLFSAPVRPSGLTVPERTALLQDHIEPMLQRELMHRGIVQEGGGYRSELLGWMEVGG